MLTLATSYMSSNATFYTTFSAISSSVLKRLDCYGNSSWAFKKKKKLNNYPNVASIPDLSINVNDTGSLLDVPLLALHWHALYRITEHIFRCYHSTTCGSQAAGNGIETLIWVRPSRPDRSCQHAVQHVCMAFKHRAFFA